MTYKLVPYELLVKQLNLVLSSILPNVCHPQCDQILQNFAHFGKSLQVFEIFLKVYFSFVKMQNRAFSGKFVSLLG